MKASLRRVDADCSAHSCKGEVEFTWWIDQTGSDNTIVFMNLVVFFRFLSYRLLHRFLLSPGPSAIGKAGPADLQVRSHQAQLSFNPEFQARPG